MSVDESQQTIHLQRKWKKTSIPIKNLSYNDCFMDKDQAFLRLVYIVETDQVRDHHNHSPITTNSSSSSHGTRTTTCTSSQRMNSTSSMMSPTKSSTSKTQVKSVLLRTKTKTDAIFWSSWLTHMKTTKKPSYFQHQRYQRYGW